MKATRVSFGLAFGTLPWLVLVFVPTGAPTRLRLVPLRDLVDVLRGDPRSAVIQIVGNLLVLAAFGFVTGHGGWARFGRVVLVAAAGSTSIEAAQYLLALGRVASVDDVLLNTAGAALAFGIGRWRWRIVRIPPRYPDNPTPYERQTGHPPSRRISGSRH
jgi:glycopeptide antibiotics resistance protein